MKTIKDMRDEIKNHPLAEGVASKLAKECGKGLFESDISNKDKHIKELEEKIKSLTVTLQIVHYTIQSTLKSINE